MKWSMQTYSTISMLLLKRQKVKSGSSFDFFCPPAPRSEDGSAGGRGEECRAVRANTKRGQPRRLACQSKAPQKNTLFIKRKRNPARAKWKEQRVFFCGAASGSERRRGGFIRRGSFGKKFGFCSGDTAKVGSIKVTYAPRYSPNLLFSQGIPARLAEALAKRAERRIQEQKITIPVIFCFCKIWYDNFIWLF